MATGMRCLSANKRTQRRRLACGEKDGGLGKDIILYLCSVRRSSCIHLFIQGPRFAILIVNIELPGSTMSSTL